MITADHEAWQLKIGRPRPGSSGWGVYYWALWATMQPQFTATICTSGPGFPMGRNTFPPAPSFDTTLHFHGGKETGHNGGEAVEWHASPHGPHAEIDACGVGVFRIDPEPRTHKPSLIPRQLSSTTWREQTFFEDLRKCRSRRALDKVPLSARPSLLAPIHPSLTL